MISPLTNERGIVGISILIVFLVSLYVFAFAISSRGWGYPGYHGYNTGGSFWYWGSPSTYHSPSVRTGSTGGPSHGGGGLSGGK